MTDTDTLDGILAGAHVDDAVFALRPDYRALLLAVDGLVPGPSDQASDAMLQAAENSARQALRAQPVDQLPHVAAWREAYRRSGPSRNAPATAWRHCCAGPNRDCRG